MTGIAASATVPAAVSGEAAAHRPSDAATLAPVQLLGLALQLGALLLLIRALQIEPSSGLPKILALVFGGFIIHALLPFRLRTPFFLVLSAAAAVIVLGVTAGGLLLLFGLILIGAAHLPIAFWMRIALIAVLAFAFAMVRAGALAVPAGTHGSIVFPLIQKLVLPVLASMFMFRLIIYMYDLRHDERAAASGKRIPTVGRPATAWTRLSYFFLLPNVCFLLFPIVDYKMFLRSYYNRRAVDIYQKGVWWICLGLTYLIIYRIIYQYLVPLPEDVQGLPGVVRFMLASYLVYIRVVGQFHLITGIISLFGFDLPPAHRFYLFASSFTDFWRRARIEWKDFMVKVFYYPALMPLQRRWGGTSALIVATTAVFITTWMLHSYQWFWLTGRLRISGADGVFWTIIGGCVLVNSLLEARGKRSRRATSELAFRSAVVSAVKIISMFAFMCILWSYWSSPSMRVWLSYLTALEDSTFASWAWFIVILVGVATAIAGVELLASRYRPTPVGARGGARRFPSMPVHWRPAAVSGVVLCLLLLLFASQGPSHGELTRAAQLLTSNELNQVDQEREDRGYYEVLLDQRGSTASALSPQGIIGVDELKSEASRKAGKQ